MKTRTLILTIIFLIILGILGWVLISAPADTQEEAANDIETSQGFMNKFFPFGNNDTFEERGAENIIENTENDSSLIGNNNDSLRQLTSVSTVGYIATTSNKALVVRYMDRARGNIYDIHLDTLEVSRITNTTIPSVANILWHKDAEDYVLRYVGSNNVQRTYVGHINLASTSTLEESSVSSLSGEFIKTDLLDIVVDAKHNNLLFLEQIKSGSAGFSSQFDTDTRNDLQLFESPFSEWILSWPTEGVITATTKSSSLADGYMYFIDTKTGYFTKVLGPHKGLSTTVSPDGTTVVYTTTKDAVLSSFVLDTTTGDLEFFSTPTLPEKCAWHPLQKHIIYCGVSENVRTGSFPEDWYQGKMNFSDTIWKIDTEQNIANILASPYELVGYEIDVIEPSVSHDGQYFLFKNKKDSTVWSLRLEQPDFSLEQESGEEE